MAPDKPIIVCVPGAFHRPSSWNAVAELLRAQGFRVLTPALAVSGSAESSENLVGKTAVDDVSVIHKELLPLLDEGSEAIIVSHSYGSLPATLAVEEQTHEERKVKGLKGGIISYVSIAGFAYPARGKSIMGDDQEPPVMPYHILKVYQLLFLYDMEDLDRLTHQKGWDTSSSRRCEASVLQ